MNAQNLSLRLSKVASFVPKGAVVADIGSDHAYLPCFLVHNGIVEKAFAGEVVKGPYESAVKKVNEEGLNEQITVRLADGLEAIHAQDGVDTITIAGMGGPLIVSILEKNPEKLQSVRRLILQPNIHAKVIRQWALDHNWSIVDEAILEEDERIYEILVLEPGKMVLSEAEILLGKKLMQEKSEAFIKKWSKELTNWKQILTSIEKATSTPEIVTKRDELHHLIGMLEEVINN